MSHGSVGKGTAHELTVPWVTLRRATVLPLGVFPDETLEQLAHGFPVNLVPR